MSWLDSLIDVGKTAVKYLGGSSIGSTLARSALMGFTLYKLNQSINKDNNKTEQSISPQQVSPNPNAKIPVVYGRALVKGIVTDAVLTNSNQDMYYCLTLCEQTGNLNLGAGAASQIDFIDVYWNGQRLIFAGDGITVTSAVDEAGNINTDVNGLIEVYCFSNGSSNPVVPICYSNGSLQTADTIMPNWTANHDMNDLVFAIVKVTYNSEKNVTGLGEMTFILDNTMTQPGDCLYDYLTNTRYGAGIDPAEIYAS